MTIPFFPAYQYDSDVRDVFHRIRFFTARSGLSGPGAPYEGLSAGQMIETFSDSRIEAYSTIAVTPNHKLRLHSIGAFSSSAADLPPQTIVGRFCSIAPGVTVMGWRHPIDAVTSSSAGFNRHREFMAAYLSDYRAERGQPAPWSPVPTPQGRDRVVIGNDVWIGSDVVLAPSVTIGDGAVIAAHSVVTKDVPAYAVVGGNPAKIIRSRYPDEITAEMMRSRWWQYDYGAMLEAQFDFANPEAFLLALTKAAPPVATYHTISAVTLEMDKPQPERALCTVHGTILRHHGGMFRQDHRLRRTGDAVRPGQQMPTGTSIARNDDGSYSIRIDGRYLSPKNDGTVLTEPHQMAWERFIAI